MKKDIRKNILNKLTSLPQDKRELYDLDLLNRLIKSKEWKCAKTIGITLSRSPEVGTQKVIEHAWHSGKEVYIPFSGQNRKLSFYAYDATTELELSSFGLLEPKWRTVEKSKKEIDLLIVPGLAYSQSGYRVGFGGGYYDRYLADYEGTSCSLLYPFQLDDNVDLTVENFDIPVQKLFVATS